MTSTPQYEAPTIIGLNIRHYGALLKLGRWSDAERRMIVKLQAEARVQLPLALAEEAESKNSASLVDLSSAEQVKQ